MSSQWEAQGTSRNWALSGALCISLEVLTLTFSVQYSLVRGVFDGMCVVSAVVQDMVIFMARGSLDLAVFVVLFSRLSRVPGAHQRSEVRSVISHRNHAMLLWIYHVLFVLDSAPKDTSAFVPTLTVLTLRVSRILACVITITVTVTLTTGHSNIICPNSQYKLLLEHSRI